MARKLIDDCFILDRDRIRHADAIALLQSRVAMVVGQSRVPLADAAGRVLAQPAVAGTAVPAHTNAAVDGYAFAHADAALAAKPGLPISGRAAAGHPLAGPPPPHTATRIFTGAMVPDGCDTVAMQEDCERLDGGEAGATLVRIPLGLKQGANVRNAGEDVALGTTLIEAGALLRPQDLAALASIGLNSVAIFDRLRVAILSSGDEIVAPGQPLRAGQVYDANMPMLLSLVTAAGASVTHLGIAPDDPADLSRRLADAAGRFDVIVASGGASQGEEDHFVKTLDALGKRHLWQIAIKPGRPMSFGQIGDCVVVGLPGNPVAVFVCFLMYIFPMLRRLGGAQWREPRRWPLPAAFSMQNRKIGRREFWRGSLVETSGSIAVDKFARDGSGLITGLRMADGLIDIPEDRSSVEFGAPIDFIPFSEFGFPAR